MEVYFPKEELHPKFGKLVHLIANKYQNHRHDYYDISSEGMVGLVKAYNSFDWARKNISFYTYAERCIHNEIRMYIRKKKIRKPINDTFPLNEPIEGAEEITLADILGCEADFTAIYVKQFLDSLSPRNRHIVEILLKGGRKRDVIAYMGCDPSYVSRVVRDIGYTYLYGEKKQGKWVK